MSRLRLTLPAMLAALALSMPMAPSGAAEDHDAVRQAVRAGRLKPLAELLSEVEARHGGKVLDVELERHVNGRQMYEIKLLERDGRRSEIYVDAVSGQEIDQRAEAGAALKPLAEVLRALLAGTPGRVLDVELERGLDNQPVYEVRIVQADGRIREVIVDAVSGRLQDADIGKLTPIESLKPLPDILDIVLAKYPGSIREIELEHDRRGRRYYEIDMRLKDGRLLEVNVDAVSGAFILVDPRD